MKIKSRLNFSPILSLNSCICIINSGGYMMILRVCLTTKFFSFRGIERPAISCAQYFYPLLVFCTAKSQWFKLREMQRKLFGTLDRFKLWLFECFQWILALKGFKNWIKAKEGQKDQWRPTKAIKGQNFKIILFHH